MGNKWVISIKCKKGKKKTPNLLNNIHVIVLCCAGIWIFKEPLDPVLWENLIKIKESLV